jgi:hypothetical protein
MMVNVEIFTVVVRVTLKIPESNSGKRSLGAAGVSPTKGAITKAAEEESLYRLI